MKRENEEQIPLQKVRYELTAFVVFMDKKNNESDAQIFVFNKLHAWLPINQH